MKHRAFLRTVVSAIVLCSICAVAAQAIDGAVNELEFLAPTQGQGHQFHRHRISAAVTFSAPVTGNIVRVTVNDEEVFLAEDKSRNPLIDTFDADWRHLGGERLAGHQKAHVQVYQAWKTGERYTVGLTVRTDGGETFIAVSQPAVAPELATYTSPLPKRAALTVTERSGMARQGWPIMASLVLPTAEVGDPARDMELVRFDEDAGQYTRVPFQVVAVVAPRYAAENVELGKDKPLTESLYEICFLADLDAGERAGYLLYYGRPGADLPPAPIEGVQLVYDDADPKGMTVDTGPAMFRFHGPSGQLMGYVAKLAGSKTELGFVQENARPIHWNPDVWSPPSGWGHVSDWTDENRPETVIARGPLCYRTVRTGVMPTSNGTRASVSYTMFAGMPFIMETSNMEFTVPTRVNAVRANELVFNRGGHTHVVWQENDAADPVTARCYDPDDPHHFYGRVAVVDADASWLGMFHETERNGIAVVNLARFSHSPGPASPQDAEAYYYFNDYGSHGTGERYPWNFVYLCLGHVLQRADIPESTQMGERSAFLVFQVGEGDAPLEDVQRWVRLLRSPQPTVRVRYP